MPDPNQFLLQTKLHRPPITRELVVRSRLVEQLNRHIYNPITLVSAPAGFGKTTLVCTWLERMAAGQDEQAIFRPSGWLSLDDKDNDLNLFLHYFIAALRTVFDMVGELTLDLLHSQQPPPPALLYTTFCNELEALPGEIILVLDDYQFIRDEAIHKLLIEMVRHWPKRLHLVLISRIDPSIPLARLRGQGMLNEIRTPDLRFTPQETAAYISQAQVAQLSNSDLRLLDERFEGWPAGLHLAALSLRSGDNRESVLSALSSNNPNIAGYLVEEVLAQQESAIHSFLLQSSILDRFNASLCEAIMGEIDAAWNATACLDWIESSELFIIPLDDRREWYRYHHLFQELLQQRFLIEMAPDQASQLHRRASTWFEAQGLIDEALQHALAAGDLDLAAQQMNAGLCDVLNREDRPALERWLSLLPEEMIQRRPELLMIRVWAHHFSWRLDLVDQGLHQLEELLDSGGGVSLPDSELQLLRGQILMLKAQQAYFSSQTTQTIDICRQILTIFPSSWKFVRGGAMLYLGMAMQAGGQEPAAEQLLLEEYDPYVDKNDSYALFLLLSLGFIYLNSGQLEQARQIGQLLLQGAIHSKITIMKNWADWFLGVVFYQRNELDSAVPHFSQIIKNRFTAQMTVYRDAIAGLALIHQIRGQSAEAWQMVESVSQFDLEQRGREDYRTCSLRARLMLLQGDLEGAGDWVDTLADPPPDQPLMWLEEPEVTRAHILVARDSKSDLRPALEILDALDEIAGRTHNARYKIEILALRALALEAQGRTGQADDVLKQALELARSGGFLRVFVDLGQPMQKMLRRLAAQGHFVQTINRILAVYPTADRDLVTNDSSLRHLAPDNSSLVEPLTPRELEVLTLLREPFSIKEIALKLSTSYATARRHTINIYGKLGVHKRWDAVARAIELGILPPD